MDKNTNERGFTGFFVPVEILADKRLDAVEIVILAEIDALAHGPLGCIASDEHFAETAHCSVAKVKKTIRHLKDLGYIVRTGWDGRTRQLEASIYKGPQVVEEPEEEAKPEKPKRAKKKEFTPPTEEEAKEYAAAELTKRGMPDTAARTEGAKIARKFTRYYGNPERDWRLGTGKKMANWKRTLWDWIERENITAPKTATPKCEEEDRYSI